jgi:hypothetical protein
VRGRGRRLATTGALAAIAALAAASGAEASSIVYVRGGDVWLAKSNGKGQRPITRNGSPRNPYRSPSYSDKGVIAAVRGRRDVYFFDRRGRRLRPKRDISGGPVLPFDPVIVDQALSPNGRWLASTLWMTTRDATPRPGEPTGTDFGTTVWYTRAKDGKLRQGTTDGGQSVTWVTNSRPLVFAPYVFLAADAYVVNLANPNSPAPWFQDAAVIDPLNDGQPLDDGELTRAQDKLAVVRGPNTAASSLPTMLRVYAVASLSQRPTERCDLRAAPNSRIESPTWSPDGRRLAWSERSGIWVSPIGAGAGGCGAAPKRLIAGGSQPDWGPAGVR